MLQLLATVTTVKSAFQPLHSLQFDIAINSNFAVASPIFPFTGYYYTAKSVVKSYVFDSGKKIYLSNEKSFIGTSEVCLLTNHRQLASLELPYSDTLFFEVAVFGGYPSVPIEFYVVL